MASILFSCGAPTTPVAIAATTLVPSTKTPIPMPSLVPSPTFTPFPDKITDFVHGLIGKVRSVSSGKIVINIDSCLGNYHTLVPPQVVAESDVIGLQLYPGPRTPPNASVETMTRALVPYFSKVAYHFSQLAYKSLISSELGITRLDGSTSKECTWIWPEIKREDLQEMADYYQAFANALDQSELRPMIDGVVLHEWKIQAQVFEGNFLGDGAWGEFVPAATQPPWM